MKRAAEFTSTNEIGNRYHIGVVHSKDSFYGEVEPENSPVKKNINSRWKSYLECGCLTSEMECAQFLLLELPEERDGGVLTALWNVERSKAGLPDNITDDSSRGNKVCS